MPVSPQWGYRATSPLSQRDIRSSFELARRGTILRIAGKRAQAEYNGKCCADWLCELREEDVVYKPTLTVLLSLRQCQLTSQSYEQLITTVHCVTTPPLKQCVTFCKDNIRQTRSSVRGDCSTKFKKTVFGQSAFSVRAAERWNLIPVYIRGCATFSILKTIRLKYGLRKIKCVIIDLIFLFRCDI